MSESLRTAKRIDGERLKHAKTIAALSGAKYRMGCVIYVGGKLISAGVNIVKTHPTNRRYPPWVVSVHAELRAILLARSSVVGGTLYVARHGGPDSEPCPVCRSLIQEAGIKYIVYYRKNSVVKERV